ncbi:protein of unknown function [Candidatus Nitrotoga arctica]|uniref:Uncharacterized protein n=1 Tax=Candidatus Nitrotoga arctica TaxID=453162 RepID=A0ABM8Z1K1_9PROT|nr:protein of unknown function [Candidatus Nitrotoga arctica]
MRTDYFNAAVSVTELKYSTKTTQHSEFSNIIQGKPCNKKISAHVINL